MDLATILKRERLVSTVINVVLSTAFFLLVFGPRQRMLTLAAPDGFALDFLPQGAAISLMAALVPSLLVRKALRKDGAAAVPSTSAIGWQVTRMLATGLAIAGLLAALCLSLPIEQISWTTALGIKLIFGGLLGFVVTHRALTRLYGHG